MLLRRHQIGFVLVSITAALVLGAGLVKFFDLAAFRASLDSWVLVPEMARGPLSILVPASELTVAGLWFSRPRRAIYLALGGMIALFTGFYILHLATVGAPDCGCFGKLDQYFAWKNSSETLLWRNTLLMALWACGGLLACRNVAKCPHTSFASRTPSRGFTLIETIVVITLIGLLIALILPSLAQVRTRSRDLVTTATIRSHAAVFATYATDYADYYPSLVHPQASSATYSVAGMPMTISGYFGQVHVWHFGVAESYYDGQLQGQLFRRAGNTTDWLISDYRYSASFMADPAFWNATTRTGPSQWRGQRATSVRYPSSKALLTDDRAMVFAAEGWTAFALCDGSARLVAFNALNSPHPTGEGEYPGTWNVFGSPGIHTVDGVHGRDLQN